VRGRVIAALGLAASVAIMATDLIRMSALAGQHLEALQLELDKVPPFPGTDRAGVMRSRKSRVAVVGNEYVGPAPRPRIFDHYRTVFVAAGWRQCGHSVAHDNYCRGEYEAIVSVPWALGSGSYSVTLQWNRITRPVWLSAGALIFIACWSLAELTRRHAPVPRLGWRSSLKLHTALTPQECVRQMETAKGRDIVFHPGETIDDGSITFGLERRQGRLTSSVMTPYFHGALRPDPATTGTIIVGSFGFHPAVRAGAVTVVVIALLALGLTLRDGRDTVEWVVAPIAVGIAGLILTRWIRGKDRREIASILTATLQAEPFDSWSNVAGPGRG
jgi:hypothetical protein